MTEILSTTEIDQNFNSDSSITFINLIEEIITSRYASSAPAAGKSNRAFPLLL